MNAEELLLENGYEGVTFLTDFSYDSALIGVSEDNRAIYDYEKMVQWLMDEKGFTEQDAIEWIDYNTIRALPYAGENAPIIMYPLVFANGALRRPAVVHRISGRSSAQIAQMPQK